MGIAWNQIDVRKTYWRRCSWYAHVFHPDRYSPRSFHPWAFPMCHQQNAARQCIDRNMILQLEAERFALNELPHTHGYYRPQKNAQCEDHYWYDLMYQMLYRALVLLKQLLGKCYTGWFAIAFPELFVYAIHLNAERQARKQHVLFSSPGT